MSLIRPITLTPIPAAATIQLPMPESVTRDAVGNVTFEFSEYLSDLPSSLQTLCSRNVEQYRTRLGTFVCVSDTDGKLFTATWDEVDPFASASSARARSATGVLVLASDRFERRGMTVGVALYRCDRLYIRGTGDVIE
ncbi:MAG: hypothetical protein HC933_02170 [Pleurocapsa sp. SU_196_0]|nr:hypothetical protein [Pleurocapsa sp. SU_196_0]